MKQRLNRFKTDTLLGAVSAPPMQPNAHESSQAERHRTHQRNHDRSGQAHGDQQKKSRCSGPQNGVDYAKQDVDKDQLKTPAKRSSARWTPHLDGYRTTRDAVEGTRAN